MTELSFLVKLDARQKETESLLCVGLDPDLEKLPKGISRTPEGAVEFLTKLISETAVFAAAFKPNAAFFEAFGEKGWWALKEVISAVPKEIPVILDAKRGDIGNSAARYAHSAFELLNADAITVNPYMGSDSLEPFLCYHNKGTIALCLTSNPGAVDFQIPHQLYLEVARKSIEWRKENPNVGLVVGATQPEFLAEIRKICPETLILSPGIGAQGAEMKSLKPLVSTSGNPRILFNASRAILYASSGSDFADAARRKSLELKEQLHGLLT